MVMAAPTSMTAPARLTPQAVLAALDEVPDPEIPTVSIVELGMIGSIDVGSDEIVVELLPTFVGCPALEVIRDAVQARVGELGRSVRVEVSFATPWSSDRITKQGREKLRASGFAPPAPVRPGRVLPMLDAAAAPVACPYCGSTRTKLENVFGPTQCRSIRHCAECRQPFESFKPV